MFVWFFDWKKRRKEQKSRTIEPEVLPNNWRSSKSTSIGVDYALGKSKTHTEFFVNGRRLQPGTLEYEKAMAQFNHDMREFRLDMKKMQEDLRNMFK